MVEREELIVSMIVFLYCFANRTPIEGKLMKRFTLEGGHTIDVDGDTGIFTYDDIKKRYRLFGMTIRKEEPKLSRASLMKGLLSGYKILDEVDNTAPVRSLTYLDDHRETIEESSIFRTYLYGNLNTVIRDSSVTAQVRRTYNRHLDESLKSLGSATLALSQKRMVRGDSR